MHEAPRGVSASHEQTVRVQRGAQRAFLTAPYVADAQGQLGPVERLDQCPFAAGAEPCRLWQHSKRRRKTGPRPSVGILKCRTHAAHFTVYPVGFTPYGRERIAPVQPDGEPASDAISTGVKPWRETFFPGGDGRGGRPDLAPRRLWRRLP